MFSVLSLVYTKSMKKLTVIFLILFYAVFSAGFNVLLHTCGGETEALLATASYEDPCGCTDAMPDYRCCTTELTTVKLIDAQQVVVTKTIESILSVDILFQEQLVSDLASISSSKLLQNISISPSPPFDLNILHSVFLI